MIKMKVLNCDVQKSGTIPKTDKLLQPWRGRVTLLGLIVFWSSLSGCLSNDFGSPSMENDATNPSGVSHFNETYTVTVSQVYEPNPFYDNRQLLDNNCLVLSTDITLVSVRLKATWIPQHPLVDELILKGHRLPRDDSINEQFAKEATGPSPLELSVENLIAVDDRESYLFGLFVPDFSASYQQEVSLEIDMEYLEEDNPAFRKARCIV